MMIMLVMLLMSFVIGVEYVVSDMRLLMFLVEWIVVMVLWVMWV